jgi:hypothetical protein
MAIVQKPMLDPVMVLETGMTYERANIEAWIQTYMYEPFFKRSQPSIANEPLSLAILLERFCFQFRTASSRHTSRRSCCIRQIN